MTAQPEEGAQTDKQVSGNGGNVYSVDHRTVLQKGDHLFHDGHGHIGLGLAGRGPQVRRADQAIQSDQRRILGGFGLENIQRGAGDLPRRHGLVQVVLLDDAAAGTVDQHDPVFHLGKGRAIDQTDGILQLGHMNRNEIRPPVKGFQIHTFEAGAGDVRRIDMGVVNHDIQAQTTGTVRHDRTDLAEADHPQSLAENFAPLEPFFIPAPGTQRCGSLGHIAGQRHEHGNRMLGRRDHITIRGVHDHDTMAGGRRDIDIVQSDARPADHL